MGGSNNAEMKTFGDHLNSWNDSTRLTNTFVVPHIMDMDVCHSYTNGVSAAFSGKFRDLTMFMNI